MAIIYAVCVWLFSISPSTTYIIMAVVGAVGVVSWFLPKKKGERPA
ncbi:MAG: hypothetical protein M5U22_10145 [Thermoleophilia bacterium]|nr:hypothetical protein [Thermoleophilia bacterium]